MTPGIAVAITLLNVIHVFQILNFLKYYGTKDGANETRIILFAAFLCFQIHLWRVAIGSQHGYFFLAGLCLLLYLFIKAYVFK